MRAEAIELASTAAVRAAAALTEQIITDHLRPALDEVYEKARACAKAVGGDLEVNRLLTAPEKARRAYAELEVLVARRRMIFEARRLANTIGHRVPEHDTEGTFSEFEWPFATVPGFVPLTSGRWMGVPAPEDDRERLLWVVSDAVAPAKPWLPTVAELDEAWRRVFGEQLEQRRQYAANAAAIAARGDFQVGRDIARTLR